jgi:DNA-binding CsgD family transcriptional regulator
MGQCRIALLLSDGQSPREIGNSAGVTENTVRYSFADQKHLRETGMRRQSELIRLILNHTGPVKTLSRYTR